MESLVVEEVERQLQKVALRQKSFIAPDAVATYALNRLKPLYANSIRGYECQEQLARREFGSTIELAVRQGIAAVERDPLRMAQPLDLQEDGKAEQALRAMKRILQRQDLDWENLPDVLEEALNGASHGQPTWRPREASPLANPSLHRTHGRLRSRP